MIFDVALLKTLTGRDTVTARHLYQAEFEFVPAFKLVMNTNYLPVVNDDSVFASGRVKVVEFNRHFEPGEQDIHLKDKLRQPENLSAILSWALEGLQMYHKGGDTLQEPKAVQLATAEYRRKSDKVQLFIDETFIGNPGGYVTGKQAYAVYQRWCQLCGYGAEGKRNFLADLRAKGLLKSAVKIHGSAVHNVIMGVQFDLDQYGNPKENPWSEEAENTEGESTAGVAKVAKIY
jgi:putative DNA primase/helicase